MSRFSVDRLSVLKKDYTGRLSMLLNEDDYDYALELRPDDEYRYMHCYNRLKQRYVLKHVQ
jgi:hypothetical protein